MRKKRVIRVQKWPHHYPPIEEELEQLLLKEGLEPFRWTSEPGSAYALQTLDYGRVIYVVEGSITFGFPIEGEPTTLSAGDRLDLPAGTLHNAAVGLTERLVCLEARAR